MKKMKTAEDFASKDYPVLLHRDREGDYIAEIPDLPGCMTDARTKEEALREIEDAKRAWIAVALEKGMEIPEPRDLDGQPSGKILLRLPKSLHRSLWWEAEREGVSLNQSVVFLLTKAIGIRSLERARDEAMQAFGAPIVIQFDPDIPIQLSRRQCSARWTVPSRERAELSDARFPFGLLFNRSPSRHWIESGGAADLARASFMGTDLLAGAKSSGETG